MITTITIVFGVIAAIVVAAILLLTLINKRAHNKASVVAVVDIYPSGKSNVEFIPDSNVEDTKLIKTALLYAAKVRYVQSEENPQIVEAYEMLMGAVVAPSELSESNDFIERLSEIAEAIQSQDAGPGATKTGERFTVRLLEGRRTDFVHTDLPVRGLAINIPVSVVLLARAVARRIDKGNVKIFERAFANLNRKMFDGGTPQMSILNQAALDSLNAVSKAS
jgi:hypothetical protein